MNEITNADRAERLHRVLETYNDEWDTHANLIDLLADARHWCDKHRLDFAKLDRTAYGQYLVQFADEQRRPV